MSLRRYEWIKDLMEIEKELCELCIEHGKPEHVKDIHKKYTEKIREELKRIDRNYIDPLQKPLTEDWRTYVDDRGIDASGYDYRIKKVENPDEWTDDDIEEYIMCEVGYPPICGPYDCTGKRFTMWTSFKRTPAGIVMIHRWGTDL